MSETRCKDFKGSQAKPYVATIRSRVLMDLHKKRQELFDRLRNTPIAENEQELTAAAIDDMVKKLIKAEAELIPQITDAEIEQLRLEFTKIAEECPNEPDYENYLTYLYENQPICPYCGSILTYFHGALYCDKNKCFGLTLEVPVPNVADIAWQMKTINEKHKEQGCIYDVEFVTNKENPELLFVDCAACKYLDYIQLV